MSAASTHADVAERLASQATMEVGKMSPQEMLALAQVHATLAVYAAVRDK